MSAPYRLRARRPASVAAETVLLGPPVRSYKVATNRNVVWAAAPFVLLLAYGVWLAHQGLLAHWFNSTFSVFAVTVLFVTSIVLIVYTAAGGVDEVVRVHANGILDLRAGPRAVRWDEIRSLTAVWSKEGRVIEHHRLAATDGTTITLGSSIGGVDELVDEIRARMAEYALPQVRARIADGEVVRFGAIEASEKGIAVGARVVEWSEVADVEAEGGEIVVRGRDGRRQAAVKLEEVPNAFLLAELTQRFTRGGGG
jgi:hypothetical protein